MAMDKITEEQISELFESIVTIENNEECKNFFTDLCTPLEIQSFAQRLQVAKLLNEGLTFSKIEEITGASSATISRINKCLNYGNGGYKDVLKKRG